MLHLALFVGRSEWIFISGLVGFLIGLLASLLNLPLAVTLALAMTGILLGAALLVRDVFGLLGRWSSWTIRRLQRPIHFPEDTVVPFLPVIIEVPGGRAAIDPDLDALLSTARNRIRWSEKPYRLPDELAQVAPYVLRTSASGRWSFNGPNVRLETDLSQEMIAGCEDVATRPGNFFSALCSNELAGWALTSSGHEWDFKNRFVLDPDDRMIPLGRSQLLNSVGVSTLAVTEDLKLLIALQSMSSQSGAGSWTPSGSGALEPRDGLSNPDPLLVDVITRGATRELCEEARIDPSWVGQSRVIGYSRWLDRGGKPEFYCVTKLNVHSTALRTGSRTHSRFSEERTWTADVQLLDLDPAAASTILEATPRELHRPPLWSDSGMIANPKILEGSTSVSLHLALDALARALQRSPNLLDELATG